MKDGILDNVDLFVGQITPDESVEIAVRLLKWSDSNTGMVREKIQAMDHVQNIDEVSNIINENEAKNMEKKS